MVIFLPFSKELEAIRDVIRKLESKPFPEVLAELREQTVEVKIPKFSLRSQTLMDPYLRFVS